MLQNLSRLLQQQTLRYYSVPAAAVKLKATAAKPRRQQQQQDGQTPIISCKRTQYNLWVPENADTKFGAIPLASNGWLSNKSKGDFFTLQPTVSEAELQAEMHDVTDFVRNNELIFEQRLLANLQSSFGIKQFTNIQVKGIPIIYNNKHTLVAAETGCGKTLTYMLPILQRVVTHKAQQPEGQRKLNSPLVLILTPGRELATQIGNVAEMLAEGLDINVTTVLGGNTKKLMMNPDFDNVDVLVATIGALSKLVTTGIYRMAHVRHVVLDEADTLLDDSFTDKLTHFLKRFPFHRNLEQKGHTSGTQLVLASATMPTNTNEILQRVIDVEMLQQVVSPNLHKLMPHIEQKFQRVSKADRPAHLLALVKRDVSKNRPLIIFSNKSATSDYVDIFLNNSGIKCLNLNGDMLMKIRLGRFEQFQHGECDVLSTTDVGSRGLDTTRARHVINYDFPLHISDYIHRCGRIGRISNLQKSLVTNFISSRREVEVVQKIEHAARTGGLLPNVNANIKNIINKRIMKDMQAAGVPLPEEDF